MNPTEIPAVTPDLIGHNNRENDWLWDVFRHIRGKRLEGDTDEGIAGFLGIVAPPSKLKALQGEMLELQILRHTLKYLEDVQLIKKVGTRWYEFRHAPRGRNIEMEAKA